LRYVASVKGFCDFYSALVKPTPAKVPIEESSGKFIKDPGRIDST
jgi:hypothetical protein